MEMSKPPKTKEECEAAGGKWDAEKSVCTLPEEDLTQKYAELKGLYDELKTNLGAGEEDFPSFEDWTKELKDRYGLEKQMADKYKYRYPYPYYPYRGYPEKPKTQEAQLPQGSGIVQESVNPHFKELESIAESLRKRATVKEQWSPVCVDVTTKELTGHLRDICILSQVIKGEAGDTVNIPYVKDLDFEILSSVGAAFTSETTGLVGSVATTLKEAGFYTTISYADIEKLDANLLAKLEEKARVAALRAEDRVVLDALLADANVPELDKTASTAFDADFVAEAIQTMRGQQKEVNPGGVALVLSPKFYQQLCIDVMGSMALAFMKPDLAKTGRLTEFLEAEIRIAGYLPVHAGSNVSAYLIKKESAVAFAPKRDLLIETEKKTELRALQMTGSHTFGRVVVDPKSAVEIKMGTTL
jgi:hypothetical protein